MQVLAIDPGPEKSAWVVYPSLDAFGYDKNASICMWVKARNHPHFHPNSVGPHYFHHLALETIVNYGMPVGESTFTTMFWIGRFVQAWGGKDYTLIKRPDIKLHLCNSARAKDANVRQALINRFGGSREKAIGKKASPGPLYGVANHIWSALAVAVTWADQREEK